MVFLQNERSIFGAEFNKQKTLYCRSICCSGVAMSFAPYVAKKQNGRFYLLDTCEVFNWIILSMFSHFRVLKSGFYPVGGEFQPANFRLQGDRYQNIQQVLILTCVAAITLSEQLAGVFIRKISFTVGCCLNVWESTTLLRWELANFTFLNKKQLPMFRSDIKVVKLLFTLLPG